MSKNIRGFTLAEILVTLGVIGVIASMTVPTLVQDIQDAEFHAAIKQFYSDMSQATRKMAAENYGLWDNTNADNAINAVNMRAEFKKYFNFVKEDEAKNIFSSKLYYYKNPSKFHNFSTDSNPAAVLSNGHLLYFSAFKDCSFKLGNLEKICATLNVDVNGIKGPNMTGRDYVHFYILKTDTNEYFTLPMGSKDDGTSCITGGTSIRESQGCVSNIIKGQPLP